jgi:hypothetical protein
MILAVSKLTKNVLTASDPNDFIFHSAYNTFKIILEGTKSIEIVGSDSNQTFTQAHSLDFTPLVTGFATQDGIDRVFVPNCLNVMMWSPKAGPVGSGITFKYIESNSTNIIFNFGNTNVDSRDVIVRYYCLEGIV